MPSVIVQETNEVIQITSPVTEVITQAPQTVAIVSIIGTGPQGPQGPQGEPGSAGTDLTWVHDQITPADTWSITHDLDKFPSVTVVDSGGNIVIGDVHYIDADDLEVTFSLEFGGKAYLN